MRSLAALGIGDGDGLEGPTRGTKYDTATRVPRTHSVYRANNWNADDRSANAEQGYLSPAGRAQIGATLGSSEAYADALRASMSGVQTWGAFDASCETFTVRGTVGVVCVAPGNTPTAPYEAFTECAPGESCFRSVQGFDAEALFANGWAHLSSDSYQTNGGFPAPLVTATALKAAAQDAAVHASTWSPAGGAAPNASTP